MTKQDSNTDTKAKLLDAALTEFVEHGYEGASTAGIAARAGVAKALVFHHYDSKETLFRAVADRVIERARGEYAKVIAETPPDLFARTLAWSKRKLAMFREDPREIRFMVFTQSSAPKAVREEIRARLVEISREDTQRLLEGVDASRLKVAPQAALEMLETMALGLEQRFYASAANMRNTAQIDALSEKGIAMLELLAKTLYRKEPKRKGHKRRDED